MWISSCCLFVVLVLAIIGVSLDILMTQQGTTYHGVQITVDYGWSEMYWSVDATNYNYSTSISYSSAYEEFCNGTSSSDSLCTDLRNIKNAGRVYIAFNIIGIFLVTVALSIAILATLGKCLCSCQCHIKWVTSILCTLSVVCFLIAFGVFLSDFSQDTNQLISLITSYKFITWDPAYVGASIGCLISASSLGLIALICILWIDSRNQRNQQYEDLSGGGYPPVYGMPPPFPLDPPVYVIPPPGPPPPGYTIPPGPYYQQVQYSNVTPV